MRNFRKSLVEFGSAPGVMWLNAMNRLRKAKRDYLVGRVVANGKRLDRYLAARRSVDGAVWPEDAAHLDGIITILERRRDAMLRQLKEG